MALDAGSCTIVGEGDAVVVTGTGLAKALADAMMAPPPAGVDSNKMLEQWANLTAQAIVDYLKENAEVKVVVSESGLQSYMTMGGPSPTAAPLEPVELAGTIE